MPAKIELDHDKVISVYKETGSLRKTGNRFGVSITPIKRVLKEENIDTKVSKYKCNESFFEEINSSNKAYWLGFLYADGGVRKRLPKDSGYNGFGESLSLRLKLADKDLSHIKIFKNDIEATNPIKHVVKPNGDVMSKITIYKSNFVENLIDKGCMPRKADKITYPNFIRDELDNDFIRGYFDGDGSVGVYVDYNQVYWGIRGNKMICQTVGQKINDYLGFSIRKTTTKSGYRLKVYGIDKVSKLYSWLYKGAEKYLYRKKGKLKLINSSENFKDIKNKT